MHRSHIRLSGPYDLILSIKAVESFPGNPAESRTKLRKALRLKGEPVVMEIRQESLEPPVITVSAEPKQSAKNIKEVAQRMILADFDLRPFYQLVSEDPVMQPVVQQFHGLKPMRPASLFEMGVIAVTEQQISMAAAQKIRSRLVERFGENIDELWLFPTPEVLAGTPLGELTACGLSGRKAEYIQGFAARVADGSLDLEKLKDMPDDEVRSVIGSIRGFGRWSADYILVRGLGRMDVVPADDLGVRTFAGNYFGDGSRMSAEEVLQAFAPYRPFSGMAMFYLMVHHRLMRNGFF